MEYVSPPNEAIASFKKFIHNYEAANNMYEELKDHVGKYVAVDDGKILGYANTYREAMERFGNTKSVFIDLITDKNIFWIL
ncbi:MAG: DUF5678 domain-containing protein [Candidatus Thermoplasmatota archaeon]|jgi:hypothetical protein|nr:DUF5678 domain-containing protein [Candidatus Thermoplasmatota archaeon]